MHVSCCFILNEDVRYKDIPIDVFSALSEVCLLLSSVDIGYAFTYDADNPNASTFRLTYWRGYFPLDEDLLHLMKEHKLNNRHLRAFCWLKRHTTYEGHSKNHNDWDMHPDDFFEYIEFVVRHERRNGFL